MAALIFAAQIAEDIEQLQSRRGEAPMTEVERHLRLAFQQAAQLWERLSGESIAGDGYVMEWLAV